MFTVQLEKEEEEEEEEEEDQTFMRASDSVYDSANGTRETEGKVRGDSGLLTHLK